VQVAHNLFLAGSPDFRSGVIVLPNTMTQVKITVTQVRDGKEWTDFGFAPDPFDKFCEHLKAWRISLVYPKNPPIRTWSFEEKEIEEYCTRYRNAFEAFQGKHDDNLKDFRTSLWREFLEERRAAGKAIHPSDRRKRRQNFIDTLDAYLADWKENKGIQPYGAG